MRKALVQNNTIVNFIEIGEGYVPRDGFMVIDPPEGSQIGWVLQGDTWVRPSEETSNDSAHRVLTKVETTGYIRAITGMTDAEYLAARNDPNLAVLWVDWADIMSGVERDHPMTEKFLGALVATGHIDADTKKLILDKWPTT